jgi:hypothetical protein
MNNFYRICTGIETSTLNVALKTCNFWNMNDSRVAFKGSPHREAEDIWLRFCDVDKHQDLEGVLDDVDVVSFQPYHQLPQAKQLIFALMATVQGERLGRAVIAKLPTGKRIYPHADKGKCAEYYNRYHIVLQSGPGCLFRCDDEEVQMKTGEIWWFNNKKEHLVINNSSDDRVHLIVDIK